MTAKTKTINILKSGLYSIQEASTYARLHYNTLSRWMEMNGVKVINDEKFISFLDLVQALAIRNIRRQHSIPLHKIRESVDNAKKKYGIEYPFARKHTTYLYGKDIYISLEENDDPTIISGRNTGQIAIRKIIELYLKDLSFNPDGWAITYEPMNGIILDPKFRFGEPIVKSVKIPAIALWEAVESEGSLEAAALTYGVSLEDVLLASKYIDSLDLKAA